MDDGMDEMRHGIRKPRLKYKRNALESLTLH